MELDITYGSTYYMGLLLRGTIHRQFSCEETPGGTTYKETEDSIGYVDFEPDAIKTKLDYKLIKLCRNPDSAVVQGNLMTLKNSELTLQFVRPDFYPTVTKNPLGIIEKRIFGQGSDIIPGGL